MSAGNLALGVTIGAVLSGSFMKSTSAANKQLGLIDTSIAKIKKQKLDNAKNIAKLGQYGQTGARGIAQLTRESERLHRSLVNLRRIKRIDIKIGNVKSELGKTSAMVTAQAAALGAVTTKLYRSASNTLKAQGEIATLGVSTKGIDQITKSGHNMAMQFGSISAPEYIRASYDIKSGIASLTEDGINQYTKLAATTALATKSTTGEMTKLYALGYGIFRKDFVDDEAFGEQFSGGIATAVKMFRTDGSDLAQGFSNIGASASSMGVSLAEQLAIIGVAKGSFNSASEAGTGYRSFLDNVGKAQENLGVKLTDGNGKLLEMPQILELIKGKFDNLEDVSQSDALKEAFGSAEAVKFIKGLIDKTDELSTAQHDLNGAMDQGSKSAAKMAEARKSGQGLERLGASFSYIGFTIGKVLEPAFNLLADGIAWVATSIATLDSRFPRLTKTVVGLTFGIMTGVVAFKMYRMAVLTAQLANLMLARSSLAAAAGVGRVTLGMRIASIASKTMAAGQWLLNAAMTANPIGLVIVGVAALAAGFVYLYKNCEPVRNFINGLWVDIKKAFGGGIGGITKLIINWSPIGLFYKAFSKVLNWFGFDLPTDFTKFGGNLISGFVGGAKSVFASIGNFFGEIWTEIRTGFSGGILGVSNLILNWSPLGIFYRAFSGVLGWFGVEMPSTFTEFGGGLIDGLMTGFTNMLPKLTARISSIGTSITSWFNDTFGFSIFSSEAKKLDLKISSDIKPNMVSSPKVDQALKNSTAQVNQQNAIQVTVNNPSSTADVSAGVANGMRQGGSVQFVDPMYQ